MSDSVRTALQAARDMTRSGDLERAETLWREILARDPSQPDALHFLARIALRTGRNEEAVSLIRRALERNPQSSRDHADLAVALQNLGWNEEAAAEARHALSLEPRSLPAHNTLGNALLGLGRPDEAIESFRRAVQLDAGVAAVHLNLAGALRDSGRAEEAAAACRRSIELAARNVEAHLMLATLERGLGRPEQAARCLSRALEIEPRHAAAHNALGNVLLDLGDSGGAEASYRAANAAQPGYVEALHNLGNLLRSAGRLDEAHAAYAGAADARPDFADAWVGLARTCLDLSRAEEAVAHFSKAAELRPHDARIHDGHGQALRALGRFDQAEAACRRAVQACPELAAAWCNLSTLCLDRDQLDEAVECARRALAAEPDLPEAHWNMAQAFLAAGDLVQGWRQYEYRLLRKSATELAFPHPTWDGTKITGKTLLVTAEQGVGDEILFASCLPDALERTERCVVECDVRLAPLFARSFPGASVIGRLRAAADYPHDLPAPDCRVMIGSLPLHFRDDLAEFPARTSYLVPDPRQVEEWRSRYRAVGEGLRVGISWRGGKEALVRRARSVPLAEWAALGHAGAVQWIDLQYGDTADDRRRVRDSGLDVHHWDDADPLADLDGFAAQIAALDLVISVDNATVHMAGALGVPTWVLLPFAADWRWMRGRDDTPWYPSVRLFRQPEPGAWGSVLTAVRAALDERLAAGDRTRERTARTAAPSVRPARERRRWAALVNDTSHWYHWGCTGTSAAILDALAGQGYAVHRVPISGLYRCAEVPTTAEEFDDRARFERYASANAWIFRELDPVEDVVINGEGSLHGASDYVLNLLYLAYAAKAHLGRRVHIINHSCYPGGSEDLSATPVGRLYRKVYQAMDSIAVREPVSLALLQRAGIPAVQSFDCLPLTIARLRGGGSHEGHGDSAPAARRGDEIVLAGSVALRETDHQVWAEFVDRMAGRGMRVTVLTGASMFPAADDAELVRSLAANVQGPLEVLEASSIEAWLDAIARASVVVSGRFHHTIAAATLGTPFVLVESNTPKNSGLAQMLGAAPPLALDAEHLLDDLVARTEKAFDAGRERPRGTERAQVAELCDLAKKNFLGLARTIREPAATNAG